LMRRGLVLAILAYAAGVYPQEAFNPRLYDQFKQKASCKALNRHGGEQVPDEVYIDIGRFTSSTNQGPKYLRVFLTFLGFIGYLDINPSASRTMLMVHGWPGMWTSWSRQITHFEKEYHLLVPDHRGFASSTHPRDVEASGTMGDLVGDLVCVLDRAGVQQAICVGHDWGSQVCWEAARMRPDRFEAVVGVAVPVSTLLTSYLILFILTAVWLQYIPSAGPFAPIGMFVKAFPKLAYQIYFEKNTQAAIAELNKDIRRSLRAVLRSKSSPPPDSFLTGTTGFLDAYSDYNEIPPSAFYSPQEEDYMVEEYSKQGFDYTLQFYTYHNRYESWRTSHEQGNYTIPQPALFVAPLRDPIGNLIDVMKMLHTEKFVPHLTTKTIDTHHWAQLEEPEEFNRIFDEWLKQLAASKHKLQGATDKRHGSGGEL